MSNRNYRAVSKRWDDVGLAVGSAVFGRTRTKKNREDKIGCERRETSLVGSRKMKIKTGKHKRDTVLIGVSRRAMTGVVVMSEQRPSLGLCQGGRIGAR